MCARVCRWYFAVISVSGVFAVTFSVIFAYVADITQEHERSTAYGLVSTHTQTHTHTFSLLGDGEMVPYTPMLCIIVMKSLILFEWHTETDSV